MKLFVLLGIFTFGMSAAACPDLSGDWICEDSLGEKWQETVKKDGLKYSFTVDGKTDDIYADGRIQKESIGSLDFVSTALTGVAEAGASMLPTPAQGLIFIAAVNKAAETTKSLIKMELSFRCVGNSIQGSGKFNAAFSIPFVLSISAKGTAVTSETLIGSERLGKIDALGTVTGKPAMSFAGGEQTGPLNETTTSKCVRK
jgi:hypothetical protein